MKKEPSPFHPARQWEIKDVLVLLLIAIILFFIFWLMQSEKTKNVVVDVKEKVEKETDFHGRKIKYRIGEVVKEKIGD